MIKNSPPAKPPLQCSLETFKNPLLGGILLGLELKDGTLTPNPAFFPCCNGSGSFFDPQKNGVIHCAINRRLSRVANLLEQHSKLWPDPKLPQPYQISTTESHTILSTIAQVVSSPKARATIIQNNNKQRSKLWPTALATAYRFDLNVAFFRFGTDNSGHFSNICHTPALAPQAIFIEQVDKLWDPYLCLDFESFISQAYNCNIHVWLDFINHGGMTPSDSTQDISVKAQFARKIAALKQKSPSTYLSAQTLSMLKEMTFRG